MTFHPLDHVEFTVSDVGRAKAFYGTAFGWEFTDYGPDYAGLRPPAGGDEFGGLMTGTPAPGGVLTLVRSPDLDASLAAVTDAGGVVLDPPYDYPGGRRFDRRRPRRQPRRRLPAGGLTRGRGSPRRVTPRGRPQPAAAARSISATKACGASSGTK